MIKLYGNPYSRANRVRWTLEISGTKYEEETITLDENGTRSLRFQKINPNGLIPVIDDDGLVLFESVPICLYIAKRYAPNSLYVDSIRDEGLLLQWSVWAITELEKHNETAWLHLSWLPEDKRDPQLVLSEQAEVSRCLSMIEQAIKANGFLVTKRFTVADLIVSEVLTNVIHAKIDLSLFPAVKNYLKKNLSQPSAKKAFTPDIIQPYIK
jgi:glutathione S-transferase